MPDTLDTITKLIQSPPGQLAAGGVLAGIVWKFFERVEAVLKDDTKLEMARWLRVKNVEFGIIAYESVRWPKTFAAVFDRVFGEKHLSLKCFWRSCLCSVVVFVLVLVYALSDEWQNLVYPEHLAKAIRNMLIFGLAIVACADYISLLKSRLFIQVMERQTKVFQLVGVLLLDTVLTGIWSGVVVFWTVGTAFLLATRPYGLLAAARELYGGTYGSQEGVAFNPMFQPFFYSAFFTSIWLWLYAGAGFLLKAACRFDIGFDWFNRKFDIEKKPLQSIGLVSGAIVAMVYWSAVVMSHLI